MLIYDSHCHVSALLNLPLIFPIAVPAITLEDLPQLIKYRERNPQAKIGIGLHPWYCSNTICGVELRQELFYLVKTFQPDFIGECGLDALKPDLAKQQEILSIHLQIAQETGLALNLHCVKAYNELLQTIKPYPNLRGVVHAFNGNYELAQQLIRKNFYLGIGSTILNPTSKLATTAQRLSLNRLLIESDAPYMPSINKASSTTFDCLIYAQRLAQLQEKDLSLVINELNQNWMNLFNLPPTYTTCPLTQVDHLSAY